MKIEVFLVLALQSMSRCLHWLLWSLTCPLHQLQISVLRQQLIDQGCEILMSFPAKR